MTTLVLMLVTGLAFSAGAWAEEPAVDSPRAVIDLRDIYVRFKVKVFGLARIMGRFERLRGQMVSDRDGQGTEVHMRIDVDSVNTDDPSRDGYLRGPTFFAADHYPHITFSGSCLGGGKGGAGRIVGDLSLRGITRRVTFRVEALRPEETGGSGGYQATAIIRRSDFGLNTLKHLVGDEVEIIVAMHPGVEA
jgi:polyisoprenoid-binding protein YceI